MTARAPLWQDPSTSGAPMRQMSAGAGDSIPPALTTASVTRAALNTLGANSQLVVPQVYLITDESRLAVATATNTYQDFAKLSEAGGAAAIDPAVITPGYYYPPDTLLQSASGAGIAGNLFLFPFLRAGKFDAMAVQVSAAATGAVVRMGLYASLASGLPGALIEEATASGPLDCSTTGVKSAAFAAARSLTQPVWLALQTPTSASPSLIRGTANTARAPLIMGSATVDNTGGTVTCLLSSSGGGTTALPGTQAGATFTRSTGTQVLVVLRGSI